MKKSLKRNGIFAVVATALLMLQSVIVLAQPVIEVDLFKTGTEIAEIKIDQLEEETIKVTLKNDQGYILFNDKASSLYVKMLDFAQISNGVYFLDFNREKGMIRKVIVKDEKGLSFEDESYVFHNYIKFKEDDKKLFVKFNNGLKEPVTIRITDEEGHVLHEVTDIHDQDYAALFNLSKLGRGAYQMSLISENFSKERKIQL